MAADLVLITGATGMIGFKTLTLLLQAGYTVRAAVRTQSSFDKIASLRPVQPHTARLSSFIVPDITVPGAYDEAVQGVKYIVHVASPLASKTDGSDYESQLIRPAIQGTIGVLESAIKVRGIQRVVITGSISSIASSRRTASGEVIDENTLDVDTKTPFANDFAAYNASKALSFAAAKEFVQKNTPSFDVIHILPVLVLGRDDTVSNVSSITKGTNGILMGPLLGQTRDFSLTGATVHVSDVAKMHVLALDPKIKGNQDFLAAAESSIDWAESFDIVKRRYPEQCAEGIFEMDELARLPPTVKTSIDNSRARNVLGIEFKTFEEQVVSVVDHFLELRNEEQK
ncbi:hypothetical protein E4U21_004477 [Claviceps maximensis]|nr:hypothetical protein E4U21_004477 [Claviceps maximensis]